jgi:hypothetical protein
VAAASCHRSSTGLLGEGQLLFRIVALGRGSGRSGSYTTVIDFDRDDLTHERGDGVDNVGDRRGEQVDGVHVEPAGAWLMWTGTAETSRRVVRAEQVKWRQGATTVSVRGEPSK